MRSEDGTLAFTPTVYDGLGNVTETGKLKAPFIEADQLEVDYAKVTNISVTSADIATAAITGAKIQNGTITNAKIGNAQITKAKIGSAQVDTLQIKGQAVTFPRGVSSGSSKSFGTSWTTVSSLYVYGATGAPLIVSFSGFANGNNTDIRLVVDGSQVFYAADVVPKYITGFSGPDGSPDYESGGMVSISHYTPNTSSGTVRVYVQLRVSNYGGAIGARSMSVLEAKR
jgi:hypothetical protein